MVDVIEMGEGELSIREIRNHVKRSIAMIFK